MSKIVHMVGDEIGAKLPEGEVPSVRTRCGRTIERPVVTGNVGPTRYELVARNGNQFFCATRPASVTCVKCKNLLTIGTTYASKSGNPGTNRPLGRNPSARPAIAQKRTVEASRAAPARTARPSARPRA